MSSTTAPRSNVSVLIAGSGPSGLALALTLVKNGIPVRILEKDVKFHAGSRGAGIHPRTLEVYNYLGIIDDVLRIGVPGKPLAIYEMPGGTRIAKTFDMSPRLPPTPSVPYRNPVLLGQACAEEILRDHLAKYNTYVERGTELVGFEQDTEGVTAHIVKHDGDQEVRETVTVDWLVGADGARSIVRKQLGLTFVGVTRSSDRMVIADLEIKGLDADHWHSWGDQSTRVIYLRPTEQSGLFFLAAGGAKADLDPLLQGRDEIAKFVRDVTNRHNLEFGEVKFLSDWRPNIRMVNKFSEGRVFVVGDAAHVHSPTGGQGMNSSVQDSFNLGWKLALVCKGLAHPAIFETYTTERLPVIREMLDRTTVLLDKTFASRADGSNTDGFERPPILHQLGVHCRASPIVVDEQPEAREAASAAAYLDEDPSVLYAGDRAPDAPELTVVASAAGSHDADETSLFKILGPTHHTALLFATTEDDIHLQSVIDAIHTYPDGTFHSVLILPQGMALASAPPIKRTDLTVMDTHGHAAVAYPPVAKGFSVIIVRPDGVVGAVVRGEEGVKRYFEGVFAH